MYLSSSHILSLLFSTSLLFYVVLCCVFIYYIQMILWCRIKATFLLILCHKINKSYTNYVQLKKIIIIRNTYCQNVWNMTRILLPIPYCLWKLAKHRVICHLPRHSHKHNHRSYHPLRHVLDVYLLRILLHYLMSELHITVLQFWIQKDTMPFK